MEKVNCRTISLSARQEKDATIIEVNDHGPGIPIDQLDHIFMPFYSTKERGSGQHIPVDFPSS